MRNFPRRGRLLAAWLLSFSLAATLFAFPATQANAFHENNPSHFRREGETRTYIYFIDYTGSAWPVGSAVTDWNQAYPQRSARVNAYYRSASTGCPGVTETFHCVNVREYSDTNPGTGAACVGDLGCALYSYYSDPQQHFYSVRVFLNNTGRGPELQRRSTACHELGHALGLWHRGATDDSCMTEDFLIAPYPDTDHDFDALFETYDHSN